VAAGVAAESVVGAVFAGERDSDYTVGWRWSNRVAVGSAGARRRAIAVVAVELAEADVVAWASAGIAGASRCH